MPPLFRIIFVLSAFTPLWLVWGGRVVFSDSPSEKALIIIVIGLAASIFSSAIVLYRINRTGVKENIDTVEIQYIDEDVVSYIITYIPVFMIDDFSNSGAVASIIILYIVLLIIYARADIAFINPVISIAGYRIIGGTEAESGRRFVVFTREENLLTRERLTVYTLAAGRLYYQKLKPDAE